MVRFFGNNFAVGQFVTANAIGKYNEMHHDFTVGNYDAWDIIIFTPYQQP